MAVKPGTPNAAFPQDTLQVLLVHDATAGSIDQDSFRLHVAELPVGQETTRVRRKRNMERDDIGSGNDFLQARGSSIGDIPGGDVRRQKRIVGEDPGVEGAVEDAGHGPADVAHADDADRLLVQRQPATRLLGHGRPALLAPGDVADLPRDRHREREHELCHGPGIGAGGVEHCNSALLAGFAVDFVGADAVLADGFEIRTLGDVASM